MENIIWGKEKNSYPLTIKQKPSLRVQQDEENMGEIVLPGHLLLSRTSYEVSCFVPDKAPAAREVRCYDPHPLLLSLLGKHGTERCTLLLKATELRHGHTGLPPLLGPRVRAPVLRMYHLNTVSYMDLCVCAGWDSGNYLRTLKSPCILWKHLWRHVFSFITRPLTS